MKVSEVTVKNLADYLRLDYGTLDPEEISELETFLTSAKVFISDYTGLNQAEIDVHESFVAAVFVLVQDMYDNRSYYVDKSHINHVIESILEMHSVNLL